MKTIFVGCPPVQMTATLTRMGKVGFGSYAVDTLKEGRELIKNGGFELVLSLENLPDGNGYDLASPVTKQGGSLFIGVETSVGYLWLPVVDHGERVLGAGAVDYRLLELELVDVLTHRSERARFTSRWVPPAPPKVMEFKPAPLAASLVAAKEDLKRQQITPVAVPLGPIRSLRLSAVKSVEKAGGTEVAREKNAGK